MFGSPAAVNAADLDVAMAIPQVPQVEITPSHDLLDNEEFASVEGCKYPFKLNKKGEKVYVCTDKTGTGLPCIGRFKTCNALKEHRIEEHGYKREWYTCKVMGCGRKFKQPAGLRVHTENWHKAKEHWMKCDYKGCGFKSLIKQKLEEHKGEHGNEGRGFKCDIEGCGFTTKIKGNLKQVREGGREKRRITAMNVLLTSCDGNIPYAIQIYDNMRPFNTASGRNDISPVSETAANKLS